jgi:ArsR family transcriptional regulator
MQCILSTNELSESTEEAVVVERLARQLKVLGEPNRLRIVQLLREGVQCNCELVDALDMAPNLISHHLRILREAGLVRVERDAVDARWIYYSLDPVALEQLAATFGAFFDPARIKDRHPACGPQGSPVQLEPTTAIIA